MSLRALLALCVAAAIAGCAVAPEVVEQSEGEGELTGVMITPTVFPGPAAMEGVLPGRVVGRVKNPAAGAAGDVALYDTTPTAVVDGQRYPLSIDANRNLNVVIASGGGVVDTELPAAAALADNAANPTTSQVGANLMAYDGATWDRVTNGSGTAASAVRVTIATDDAVNDALSVIGTGTATAATLRITQSTDDVVTTDWNGTAPPIGAGLEATALRVTLATDSTGLVSVDDNAGSLTVDNAALAVVGSGAATAATLRVTQATDDAGVASLSVLDDWDETNRCAANLIPGQVGVAAGSGVNGATVPRVTLATDDELNDDADAIRVATETLDNAIAGAEMQVDVVASLPAGANNIGDVDIVTIGGQAPAFGAGVVGATVQRVTVATDDVVSVDWNGTAPPIGGGVQATALRITTATDSPSVVAPDAAFPANTLAISARASTAKPTAMSGDGDASGIWTSRVGSVRMVSGEVAYITTTTLGADLAAVGANTGNRLVVVTVRETAGAAARVMVRNGAADTGTLIAAVSLAANGAETITFSGGINCDSGVFLDWITGAMEITVGTEDHE